MKKDSKDDLLKDNKSYLETNPVAQRTKAQEVLIKAKELEAKKIAAGKKWVRVDDRTEVLR
jgi:hypothetical protein